MGISKINRHSKVVVVTGAGVSAECGIATFRDEDGLWEKYSVEQVATPQGFFADPELVWGFYQERRQQILNTVPNPAHFALAELEEYLGQDNMVVVSQNVDGLHHLAGSKSLVEIHGSLYVDRCTRCTYRDKTAPIYKRLPPSCPECGSMMRPDVVWFGEALNQKNLAYAIAALSEADLFIGIGTSGTVYPVSQFVYQTSAYCVYVGVEKPANDDGFDEFRMGKAGEQVPILVKELLGNK